MVGLAQRVYRSLPLPLQDLAITTKGWSVIRRRYSRPFNSTLEEWISRDQVSIDAVTAFRDAQLQAMAQHARRSVPFYRQADYNGLDEIECADDLSDFPIVSKSIVAENWKEFRSTQVATTYSVTTSGTTGRPLVVPQPLTAEQAQWAVWWRYRIRHGIVLGTWGAHFGGKQVSNPYDRRLSRVDLAQRRVFFGCYAADDDSMRRIVDDLDRRSLPWIHGYPSFIADLAEYVVRTGHPLSLPPYWISFGAENVTARQVDMVQRAFGVRPIQHYGLAEGVANISQCAQGSLHIDEDFAAVEVIEGRVIGTSLFNPAFPLIRYDTGDLATLSNSDCRCGLPGRVIATLDGRTDDFLILRGGGRIGPLNQVVKELAGVKRIQFKQTLPGLVSVHIESDQAHHRDQLLQLLADRGGGDLSVSIEREPNFEMTDTGKMRLVVRAF